MANLKKILKNTTISSIEIAELGLLIPASGQVTLEPGKYYSAANEIDISGTLATKIRAGDIIVNDGVDDITTPNFTVEEAIDYLKHPDRAANIRFEAEPERMNGFASKNVQEAIEEAKSAIEGKISVLPTFLNNGLTKNKWLSLDGSMNASDQLPAVSSYNSKIAGITFVNNNNNASVDIELYKNGTAIGNKIFTWEIRSKRYAYKTDMSIITFSAGDRISCYARAVTGGGIIDATSVLVNLFVQSTDSVVGEGGSGTL